jgi:hypothetical protein
MMCCLAMLTRNTPDQPGQIVDDTPGDLAR